MAQTNTKANSTTKYIDYLSEDQPIPGQLWTCISFLSPEGIKNCSLRGLKIRGVFGTRQEADARAHELQKIDSDFHVFVGEMGKWLPWDPDPNDVKDQVYQEKELNDLMKGYKDNLEKAKKMQHDRKETMIQDAAKEEQTREEKTRARLRKKAEAITQQKRMDALAKRSVDGEVHEVESVKNTTTTTGGKKKKNKNKNKATTGGDGAVAVAGVSDKEKQLKELDAQLKKEDDLVKAEKARLSDTQNQIKDTTQNIESIDSKLSKIQELYEKLNKKK